MTRTQLHEGWPQPYRLLDAEPYWEGLEAGEIRFQHCAACDQPVWPAHSACPHCNEIRLEWRQSAGHGALYSFSTVMRGPTPSFASIAPYSVGFVEMDEGYYLFAQIDAPPELLKIGLRVEARMIRRGGQRLPVFVIA
ncbi:hypothetical protein F9288_16800 [Sphingomonas sp. CL5.1]|uniref:Zn-ribbon domain-containing OB-fold protein n=1 Tax=Sphingomonas sp. CL5.1 TaxID=2653203 RepID=UPI001581654F|nr:OB-fold domain-containing protein [Sphingomonas sp. CL5.1]QKS01101.1 hypothetical protein F9288_16800 [Sphingomonas sp. CL5.1]